MTPDDAAAQPVPGKAEYPWSKKYPVDVAYDAEITPTTMTALFDEAVKKYADRKCLTFMGKTLTYRQVGEMADRFARGLQERGIGKGSKVGLCLPNSPFYPIAYYGALKAGTAVVNFNPLYAEKEIEYQVRDSGVGVMVTVSVPQVQEKSEKLLGKALTTIISCDIGDALPPVKGFAYKALNALKRLFMRPDATYAQRNDGTHVSFAKMVKSKGKLKPVDIKPDDVAVLQYTGGTTGVPKGAALTHANLSSNIQQAQMWFAGSHKEDEQEKMLAVLPFFHVFSMTVQMNLSLRLGAELVMLPKFDLKETLETISREKPTMFAGVPTLYKAIIDAKDVKKHDLSSLKVCLSGGAALTEPVRKGFKDLTGLELVEGYGLSETSPLATANPVTGEKKLNSIGMPVPRTEVRIADLQSPATALPVGADGEICIKGPQVMQGYWKRPDETAKVMDAAGFFHTGDIGHMDEDGYVFIVDRLKDMINSNGMKVFPRKVEEAILQHPSVSEVIVIGVPHEHKGEVGKAFLVLKEGKTLDQAELTEFLKERLAPYELPKSMEVRQSLPKTMIGKPDKKALVAEEKAKAEAKKNPPAAAPKPPAP